MMTKKSRPIRPKMDVWELLAGTDEKMKSALHDHASRERIEYDGNYTADKGRGTAEMRLKGALLSLTHLYSS